MTVPTDHDLMLAVREGQIKSLGNLFERYHVQLYNFFLRQTSDRQASEDLVQDVFYRMLKYCKTYRAEGKFTTWMFSIAHNAKIDHYRKKAKRDMMSELPDTLTDGAPDPEQQSEQNDEAQWIRKALDRLPEDKREAILLSRFQNLPYEEIGQILDCTVSAVKVRVHRGLKELARHYAEITGMETP